MTTAHESAGTRLEQRLLLLTCLKLPTCRVRAILFTCRGRDASTLLNFQVYFDPLSEHCLRLSTESPQPVHPAEVPHPFNFWPRGWPTSQA